MVKLVVKSYKYNLGGEYTITSDGTKYIFTRNGKRITVPKTNSHEIDGIDGIDALIQAEQTASQTTTRSWNPLSWFQGTKKGGRRRKATHRRVKKVRRRSRKN